MKLLCLLKPDSVIGFSSTLIITALSVLACVYYLDHQLVGYLNVNPVPENMAVSVILSIPVLMGIFSIIYILIYALTLYEKISKSCYRKMFVISTTYMVTVSIKNFLKIVFGRTWPNETPHFFPDDNIIGGLNNNEQDIIAGFHPFTGLREFAAFPSGSTAITVCFVVMLAVLFPKTRIPAFLMGISVSISLVLTNIHYLSDVVAGVFVGVCSAFLALKVTGEKRAG